jgi:hypothetical protein
LTPAQSRAAVRLLGGAGEAANERLGLTFTTSVAERAAAVEALRFWRRAEAAAAGRREREVCGVVVRSCERLLADLSPS